MSDENQQPEVRQAWEQRDDESAEAFAAFKAYLEMGAERTVVGAYRQAKGKPEAKQAAGTWNGWKDKYAWQERAEASDRRIAAVERAEEEKAFAANRRKWAMRRITIQDDAWELAELLIRKAKDVLLLPVARQRTVTSEERADGKTIVQTVIVEPPRNVTFMQAVQMLNLADRMRRLAAEMATERVLVENLAEQQARWLADARDALRESKDLFQDEPLSVRAANICEAYGFTLEKLLDGYTEEAHPAFPLTSESSQ